MFKKACDVAFCSIVITDADGKIIYVNDACCKSIGYSREELIGQTPRIFKSGLQPDTTYVDLWNAIRSGQKWVGQFANKKRDGTIYWEGVTITPYDDENNQRFYIAIKEDVTHVKELRAKLDILEQLHQNNPQ